MLARRIVKKRKVVATIAAVTGALAQIAADSAAELDATLALTTILIENLKYFDSLFDYYFERKPKVF